MPDRVNDPRDLQSWMAQCERRIRALEARRIDAGAGLSQDYATKEMNARISGDTGNAATLGEDGGIYAENTITSAADHNPLIIQKFMTAGQTIGNAADTLVSWSTQASSGNWTTTASAITIPEDGWYHVNVEWQWANNITGNRVVHVVINGTGVPADVTTNSIAASSKDPEEGEPTHTLSHYHTFVAGDVLRVFVFQNSGGNLGGGGPYFGDVRGRFTVAKWGDAYPPELINA